jgi:cobalt/nickel transport system ATP-binding protein
MTFPDIDITDLSYAYPDGTAALDHVTIAIPHGQKVALIGPNGAGKSTLLLAIGGFVTGSGRIMIDGVERTAKTLKSLRAVVGCCVENPDDQLFMPTLREDVAFGPLNMTLPLEEVHLRVREALETVGLWEMANRPPHHLSAGQKRAAAVATVLSMSPKIITLDEPDGSLDPRNRRKLAGLLRVLTQTLVLATCNMSFAAAVADRAILVDHGRIAADGDVPTIMADRALMEEHGLEVPPRES